MMMMRNGRARVELSLETLEDRLTPAITVQALDLDLDGGFDDFVITGDSKNTTIRILDNDLTDQITIEVDRTSNGPSADDPAPLVTAILNQSSLFRISMGGGNDRVEYVVDSPLPNSEVRSLLVNLGAGNDAFSWDDNGGGLANDCVQSIEVSGGGGKDDVDFRCAQLFDAAVTLQVDLGGGNDGTVANPCTFDIDDLSSGGTLEVDYQLGSGNNVAEFFIGGVGAVGTSTVDLDVLGGNVATHKDTVTLRLDGQVGDGTLPSIITTAIVLNGGNDTFDANLIAPDLAIATNSQVHITGIGGNGKDTLRVNHLNNGTDSIFDTDSALDIEFLGGAGNDLLRLETADSDIVVVDGRLRLRLFGGAGNDTFDYVYDFDNASVGSYDYGIFGGAGNDTLNFISADDGGANASPTAALLDGGLGTDTLVTGAAFQFLNLNFEL